MSNTIESVGGGSAPESVVDREAYFRRIGYTGSREVSVETLSALAAAHVQTIPFENVDVLLGRGIFRNFSRSGRASHSAGYYVACLTV